MDKIVLDIETKNTFQEVGGESKIGDLLVSLIGIYSYNKNEFFAFTEHETDKALNFFKNAGLIIGFSINRFDIPVLESHFSFSLKSIPRLDILEEVELSLGHRISLDSLAKTNLGIGKTHHSLEAIRLYKENKIDELKSYCLNDVKITRDLYELAKKQKHLLVQKRDSQELVKAHFDWKEILLPDTLF